MEVDAEAVAQVGVEWRRVQVEAVSVGTAPVTEATRELSLPEVGGCFAIAKALARHPKTKLLENDKRCKHELGTRYRSWLDDQIATCAA